MIEEEQPSETTKHSLTHDIRIMESMQYDISNMIVPKENPKIYGCQTFLYLTIFYLLAVTIFYLLISFTKSIPVECQLACQQTPSDCQCDLGRIAWTEPSILELNWLKTSQSSGLDLDLLIEGAIVTHNNQSLQIILEPQIQENCYPSGCQALLGLLDVQIPQDSRIKIIFKAMPFQNEQLLIIIRQFDSRYPQLSTRRQLALNLLFAVVIGIYTFIRKHFPLEYSVEERAVRQKQEKEQIFAPEIQRLQQQLAESYQEALKAYQKYIQEDRQLDYESSDELQIID